MAFVRDAYCVTPIMTSATSPNGTAYDKGHYGDNASWKSLNGSISDINDCWSAFDYASTGTFGYISVSNMTVRGYNLYPRLNRSYSAPKDWFIEAWNGSSFVIVDTRTNITNWVELTKKTFTLSAPATYSQFQIRITASNDPSYVAVGEWELLSDIVSFSQRPQAIGGF